MLRCRPVHSNACPSTRGDCRRASRSASCGPALPVSYRCSFLVPQASALPAYAFSFHSRTPRVHALEKAHRASRSAAATAAVQTAPVRENPEAETSVTKDTKASSCRRGSFRPALKQVMSEPLVERHLGRIGGRDQRAYFRKIKRSRLTPAADLGRCTRAKKESLLNQGDSRSWQF